MKERFEQFWKDSGEALMVEVRKAYPYDDTPIDIIKSLMFIAFMRGASRNALDVAESLANLTQLQGETTKQ